MTTLLRLEQHICLFWESPNFLSRCKPYDTDLIKSLSARWVRSKVSIWYQSATSEDIRARGYTITRLEGTDCHPIKTMIRRETLGTEN